MLPCRLAVVPARMPPDTVVPPRSCCCRVRISVPRPGLGQAAGAGDRAAKVTLFAVGIEAAAARARAARGRGRCRDGVAPLLRPPPFRVTAPGPRIAAGAARPARRSPSCRRRRCCCRPSVSVPGPALVRPPVPPMLPSRVTLLPPVSNMPPPAPSVSRERDVDVVPVAHCRPPPFSVSAAGAEVVSRAKLISAAVDRRAAGIGVGAGERQRAGAVLDEAAAAARCRR